MKKYRLELMIFFAFFLLIGCSKGNMNGNENLSNVPIADNTIEEGVNMSIKISVNGYNLTATLEKNDSAKAFYELVKNGLTLHLSEYGGFEKVGAIGRTLPSNDTKINAKSGDLILYASNQLSFMYGSNTWNYTKLGVIDNLDQIDLTFILGRKDAIVTFTI